MFPYRVLVVEDHPFQREYLLHLLREQGVENAVAAEDGSVALELLGRESFDLIMSDLLMPGLDGVQLIQQVADLKVPPQVALMSSSSQRMLNSAGLVARALGLSVLGQLPKPVQPDAIRQLLGRLANRRLPSPVRQKTRHSRDRLEQALGDDEIQAWFQPKKSVSDGRIIGAEALVRWVQPGAGARYPGEFIEDIEALGLDEALLWKVTAQALRAQATWWGALGRWVPVSVNLPTHLLDDASLPDRLHDFVIERGGSPSGLCFELTEGSKPNGAGNYFAGACRLRMKGFGLAQDDFGQGHSSFYHLVSAPFTELKIDRALVHGCVEDEVLASALNHLVGLGHRLGLSVVAEGVETRDELQLLRNIGCDQVQGFIISEAVTPEVFEQLLVHDRVLVKR